MQNILSKLKKCKAGEKTEDVLTVTFVNAVIDALNALANGENMFSGANIRLAKGAGRVMLSADPKATTPSSQSASEDFFQLFVTTDPNDTSETPAKKIRIVPSTLAGGSSTDILNGPDGEALFSAGDDPQALIDPAEGVLIGGISWNVDTGVIEKRWIEIQGTFPDPSTVPDGTDYVEIGTVHWVNDSSDAGGHWTVNNSGYGPITANVCRNWFASEAPLFGVQWGFTP